MCFLRRDLGAESVSTGHVQKLITPKQFPEFKTLVDHASQLSARGGQTF